MGADYDDMLNDPFDHEWCEMHELYTPCKLCYFEAQESQLDRDIEDDAHG